MIGRSGAHPHTRARPRPRSRKEHPRARHRTSPVRRPPTRAALVAVDSYDVVLDLTTGPETFSTQEHDAVHARAEGARPSSTSSASPSSRSPSTVTASTRPRTAPTSGSRCPVSPPRTTLVVEATGGLHQHRRGPAPLRRPGRRRGLPLQPVRGAGLPPDVRRLRAARPQGHVRLHGHRAGPLAGRVQLPHAGADARRRPTGPRRDLAFAPTPGISCYITALVAGPYDVRPRHRPEPAGRGAARASSAAARCLEYLDADNIFDLTKRGFAFFEDEFDSRLPVREVRPDLHAGVQRRRDGERRRRDHQRDLRLPLQGHRVPGRAPRR